MQDGARRLMHAYLPANFHDPIGLALRILRSGEPAALLAMNSAIAGTLLTPLDLMLQPAERRACEAAPPARWPLILVCGPPRSGTTVVAQCLIRNLELGFFNNLTAMFPRSPITAQRLFGERLFEKRVSGKRGIGGRLEANSVNYHNYYGKSDALAGPNDALYLWDRWFGKDRTRVPDALSEPRKQEMRRFFAAWEQLLERPILNKNNSLNTCADVVADALPHAWFLCMRRDPVYLAQALLIARRDIHGDEHIPYGVHPPGSDLSEDPVTNVCRQVTFFERAAREQERRLGSNRFCIVSYERFCEDPRSLLQDVSERILGRPLAIDRLDPGLKPFEVSRRIKMDVDTFHRIEQTLQRMGDDQASDQASDQAGA